MQITCYNVSFPSDKNIWIVTAKGNLTRRGAGQVNSFDVNVCDYRSDLCPIKKGGMYIFTEENVILL